MATGLLYCYRIDWTHLLFLVVLVVVVVVEVVVEAVVVVVVVIVVVSAVSRCNPYISSEAI